MMCYATDEDPVMYLYHNIPEQDEQGGREE
jgi:hypothetical protein